MKTNLQPFALLLLALTLLLTATAGCSRESAPPDLDTDASAAAGTASTLEAPPAEPRPDDSEEARALTLADLDTYARGKQKEIELVSRARRDSETQADEAKKLALVMSALPQQTQEAAAEELGLSAAHYRQLTGAIDEVLGKREMSAAMAPAMTELDTAALSEEERAQVRANLREMEAAWGDPYEGLDPEVGTALEGRADELGALRAELVGLQFSLAR